MLVFNDGFLLASVPFVFAILFWLLSKNEWFLSTELGEYIFVNRDFYDANGTALPFDSTGPTNIRAQASEVFSKSLCGRPLPNLSDAKQPPDFVLDKQALTQPNHYPYMRHYDFLQKTYLSQDNGKAKVKSYAAEFMEQKNPHFGKMYESYLVAMQQKGFSDPFQQMLRKRKAFMSFHTFGKDMALLKTAITQNRKTWRHFIATYSPQNEVYYTEIATVGTNEFYKKSFSAKEFFQQSLDDSGCIFLVQEDYYNWDTHGKLNEFGKRAHVFWHPFKIIRWIILDDVDCWNLMVSIFGGKYVCVNSVRAALEDGYFEDVVKNAQVGVWQTPGYWSLVLLCSFCVLLITAMLGPKFTLGVFTFSHAFVFHSAHAPIFESVIIYILLAAPLFVALLY